MVWMGTPRLFPVNRWVIMSARGKACYLPSEPVASALKYRPAISKRHQSATISPDKRANAIASVYSRASDSRLLIWVQFN